MPIERYRSAEALNAEPAKAPTGDAFERFVRHCARFRLISPPAYPRGVFKFETLEAAQRARARVGRRSGGATHTEPEV